MRIMHRAAAAAGTLLALGALLWGASWPAAADDASPSPSDSASSSDDAPTEAGTSFRTATAIPDGQTATASASSGDYLYWSFPADQGQRPTVRAEVKVPSAVAGSTWQIDVYDGLRRRQSCMYGAGTRKVAEGATSVSLACTLRPVRGWAEPWANDPLPGTYYVRLTAVDAPPSALGLPVDASVSVAGHPAGGAHAVGGHVEPLAASALASGERKPEDGWSSGLATDRWAWTAGGGALAALTGVGGFRFARRRG
ncbi:hypothetical protein [Streptomyces sp. NPDC050560]|uniref:hypothetical protein n=1 Tax=Streptomyces sp. NPDC050560 TaxID=3365630 RepID=UPI0037917EB7